MVDYKERFESWQKAAKEKFEEIDKQLGLKDKLEEGVKVAKETAEKGAEALKDGVEKLKAEAEKSGVGKQAVKVAEDTLKTAGETAKTAWDASGPIRDAAEGTGEKFREAAEDTAEKAGEVLKTAAGKAGEVFETASGKASEVFETAADNIKKTAKTTSDVFSFGASWTKTIDSALKGISKTTGWVAENPLQAAATGTSMLVGAGLGAGFSLISSNWLFQSALPAWSIKKISEQFTAYLKEQEELIAKGELSEAEAEKIRFEREIVKYAGAPLLGAFSCAAGAMMWANILNPKTITGFPIGWLIGGNPLLEGVWLFGNGLVCFKVGMDFFMVSLEDQEEVQRIVKEIKGMLPQGN